MMHPFGGAIVLILSVSATAVIHDDLDDDVQQSISERSAGKNIDLELVKSYLRAYLCTGDKNWYSRIGEPFLKHMMHVSIEALCSQRKRLNKEILTTFIQDLIEALTESTAMSAKKTCFQEALVIRVLRKSICEYDDSPFAKDGLLGDFLKMICPYQPKTIHDSDKHIKAGFCAVMTAMTGEDAQSQLIRAILGILKEFACEKERQKRQFDLISMIHTMDVAMCKEDKHGIKTRIGGADILLVEYWCCLIKIVQEELG